MKPKTLLFLWVVLMFITLYPFSLNAQTDEYNYSVKNRWTVKASISRYKTAYNYGVFTNIGDFFYVWHNRKMINFKMEANYGINKFIETGVYTGFQHYEWINADGNEGRNILFHKSFAPIFGVNVNFHVLPFLVKPEDCRWDLYLTAKYGGCYLPHLELDEPYFDYSKYRQEYGLGLGAGYYFKNIIGLFAESSVGQFSYFPEYAVSNFRFRIGIAAKF